MFSWVKHGGWLKWERGKACVVINVLNVRMIVKQHITYVQKP